VPVKESAWKKFVQVMLLGSKDGFHSVEQCTSPVAGVFLQGIGFAPRKSREADDAIFQSITSTACSDVWGTWVRATDVSCLLSVMVD